MAKKRKYGKKEKLPLSCDLCGKGYKTERGLINHKCHIKIRLEEFKSAPGRIAYAAYERFYQRMSRNNNQKQKTVHDFVNSTYYDGFMKFGKYVIEVKIPHYQEYLDFLITYNTKLESWSSDAVYATFIKGISKREPPDKAVEKSFKAMVKWSSETKKPLESYFKEEDKYRILHSLKTGRISPWVLYNCGSGSDFISTLDSHDLNQVFDFIDPNFWTVKFLREPSNTEAVKYALKKAGL